MIQFKAFATFVFLIGKFCQTQNELLPSVTELARRIRFTITLLSIKEEMSYLLETRSWCTKQDCFIFCFPKHFNFLWSYVLCLRAFKNIITAVGGYTNSLRTLDSNTLAWLFQEQEPSLILGLGNLLSKVVKVVSLAVVFFKY